MGLAQSLHTAVTGLKSHQTRMDTIGNNLSNVNTVGFKKGAHHFSSLFYQHLNGGVAATGPRGGIDPISLGLGTSTGAIKTEFRQGSVQTTGNVKDVAIEGNGFFVVDTGTGGIYKQSLTRDGSFYLGSDGTLRGGDAYRVMGYGVTNGVVDTTGALQSITIPIGVTGGANETTKVSLGGNLNSNVDAVVPNTISPADTTWERTNGRALSLGHVETSTGLYDSSVPGKALASTDLKDLQFMRGTQLKSPFAGIAEGDKVTISFRKGGLRKNATFTYGTGANADGNTLSEFSIFLTGGLGDDGATSTEQRLVGGAFGTVRLRERTTAVDGYNAPEDQAGAYLRSYAAGDIGSVDYDGDAITEDTTRLSIAGNLGPDNAIRNIEISYNNVNYTDMFDSDIDYGGMQGGSTTTNFTVYDSNGDEKNINLQMSLVGRETGFSTWRWTADSIDDSDVTWTNGTFNNPVSPTTNINVGTGLIRFDSQGKFISGSELSESNGIVIDQGANPAITIDIIPGTNPQDFDFSQITQIATSNDLNMKSQDGSSMGTLDSFAVTNNGTINGVYTNGVVEPLGQLAIALVRNEQGMIHRGDNLFEEAPASGIATISTAETDGRGSIRGGALEQSNVELSKEFADLITTERGFQANSRVVTTSDEMLQELVRLKR